MSITLIMFLALKRDFSPRALQVLRTKLVYCVSLLVLTAVGNN